MDKDLIKDKKDVIHRIKKNHISEKSIAQNETKKQRQRD